MQPPEPFTFLIDRCLGSKIVAGAMLPALKPGERIELLDDHFAQDALDPVWIPVVGAKGWVILTKDKAIRRNPLEIQALLAADTAVFIFMNANVAGPQIGAALVLALPGVRTAARRFKAPILGGITVNGEVSVSWDCGVRLSPPKQVKIRRKG